MRETQARAVAATEMVREAHPAGVAAVVSHADVIKAVVAHYVGVHLDLFQRLVVSTASVSVLRFSAHGPRLMSFNDTGAIPPVPQTPEDAEARSSNTKAHHDNE